MSKPTRPSPVFVPIAQRRRQCAAMLQTMRAPMTFDHLQRLAAKYEARYRRARTSKRPPAPHLLHAMLDTARVFYSLARAAQRRTDAVRAQVRDDLTSEGWLRHAAMQRAVDAANLATTRRVVG